jgi:hypothetical protein
MLSSLENVFLKCQKIPNKNLARTSWHSMCARQVLWKTYNFSVLCKKDKKCLVAIFAPKFVFFTHNTKMLFFCETTLWEHKMSRTTCNFCCWFFWHFKLCLKHISKNGSICSWVPKRHPQWLLHLLAVYMIFLSDIYLTFMIFRTSDIIFINFVCVSLLGFLLYVCGIVYCRYGERGGYFLRVRGHILGFL